MNAVSASAPSRPPIAPPTTMIALEAPLDLSRSSSPINNYLSITLMEIHNC